MSQADRKASCPTRLGHRWHPGPRTLASILIVALPILLPNEASAQGGGSPHGSLPEGVSCMDCHSMDGWSPILEDPAFQHGEATGFSLAGRHKDAGCRSCHETLRFSEASAPLEACGTCHLDVHSGSLGADCSRCHVPTSFRDIHGLQIHQQTGFLLDGAHLQISCESCHTSDLGGAFSPLSTDCLACHQEDFESSGDIDHVDLGFPSDCLACHTPVSWSDVAAFDHESYSGGFRLQGPHQRIDCSSCHVAGGGVLFNPTDASDCVACHQADFQREHAGSGYPQNCTVCHTLGTWDREPFDHSSVSGGFVLEGAHQNLFCTSCHTPDLGSTLFFPTGSEDCVSCHLRDYQDEHAASGYPTNCLDCHTVTTWDGATADHVRLSGGFGLVGNHGLLPCTSCHVPGGTETLFDPATPEDCVACHQTDYQTQHAGSGYPTTCLNCHQVTTWGGAVVDHAAMSGGFALPSDHETLECASCHTPDGTNLFNPTDAADCVACHQADYQREHSGSGYPQNCTACHTTAGWSGATADHEAISGGFALLGGHGLLPCTSCHVPGGTETLFDPSTPEDCLACHQTDYQAQHAGSGYPTTCLSCHALTTWSGATLDHASISGGFLLPSDHEALGCLSCHTPEGANLFSPTSANDCVACHQADYLREHSGSGYPQECTACHSTSGWSGATADHNLISGGFALLGNHNLLNCGSCHVPGGTETLFSPSGPDDCLACHQTEFQGQHAGSGYPSTCLSCHVITTWTGAQFNHDADYFPIFSGKHQGRWNSCQSCHSNPDDFTVFTCLNCHEHNQSDTNRDHSEVPGYVYESNSCLSCHPTGTD